MAATRTNRRKHAKLHTADQIALLLLAIGLTAVAASIIYWYVA